MSLLLILQGSSAGAGSEVFHVYRHLRRYEMSRQKWIDDNSIRDDKDLEFYQSLAEKKIAAEERTAKKRAKRCVFQSLSLAIRLY